MSEETLEAYLRQLMAATTGPEVQVAWQGGEPMLRGLDLFRRTVELAAKWKRPHQRVLHTMQTNGTLVDDEWAAFFKANRYLVGLSIDGPRALHDAYRVNKKNQGSFYDVIRGWECLKRHGVDVNVLCTIHADGEPGLNYLCAGYKAFFQHIDAPMRVMASLLREGRYADEIMQLGAEPRPTTEGADP